MQNDEPNNSSDRRSAPRVRFLCKLMMSSPLRMITSHTEDISEGGIRVVVDEKLSPFMSVGLELYVDKNKPIKCKGKIAWVKELVNPVAKEALMYEVGVKIVDINEFDKNYLSKIVKAFNETKEQK